MKTLLSVPPALARSHPKWVSRVFGRSFATHDPEGSKLGSGGGTAHLLIEAWKDESPENSFENWLSTEKRILLHAGGQSRRLPAYAPCGKALLPVPVLRWCNGQRIDQTLGELQLPLLRKVLEAADEKTNTLVASGDVLVWNEAPLPPIPSADVVCIGLWDSAETASGHGVFFAPRSNPSVFDFMLQKPAPEQVVEKTRNRLFLLDVGIWLLSDRAVSVLMRKCGWDGRSDPQDVLREYDLYGSFGLALGEHPTVSDPEVGELTAALVALPGAEFHHFGTSGDLLESSLALQNRVNDQRRILSPLIKPHPSIFIQNADVRCGLSPTNRQVWIENSSIPESWTIRQRHVFTGVPANAWSFDVPAGICLDFVPLKDGETAFRPYGFSDAFRGDPSDSGTGWMGKPVKEWFERRGLDVPKGQDLQKLPLFPLIREGEEEGFLRWMIEEVPGDATAYSRRYRDSRLFSAEELGSLCDAEKVDRSRRSLLVDSLPVLARHAGRSVFLQCDLHHAAALAADSKVEFPESSPDLRDSLFGYLRERMFRATLRRFRGQNGDDLEEAAFGALRDAIVDPYRRATTCPRNSMLSDQVVWARSPLRLDLAGGWTDTPPYCFLEGGRVVNLAVELNGQPPVQVFARSSESKAIVIRSIDLGSEVVLRTYEDVRAYADIGSGFAIPRAALALCGFHPEFQAGAGYPSLEAQLEDFGGGLELSLLCAVPKGSGLGTSSILSAAVLGCLSELAGFEWDSFEIGNRVLAIEQMLTSGGGWQDQFGGLVRGVKMMETLPGLDQTPDIRWLPGHFFTRPEHQSCQLLYYTGVTRVAHSVLSEIVRGMFLNRREHLSCLAALSDHASNVFEVLQKGDFDQLARLVDRTWQLNQKLDSGTNPPEIRRLLEPLEDLLAGKKLLGAGGGGYLLMMAKDADAAVRIRRKLGENPPNSRARFVDFALSETGLQVTRS